MLISGTGGSQLVGPEQRVNMDSQTRRRLPVWVSQFLLAGPTAERRVAASPEARIESYWKFSIIIRSAPKAMVLLKRIVFRSGDTLNPTKTPPSIFANTRLTELENWKNSSG